MKNAINASWLRVHGTVAAVALLKRLRPRLSSVLFLTTAICVKYGSFQHLSEAAAMRYIASNTDIPVPKIYCAFKRKGVTYIVMSRIAGSPIGHKWEQRSDESKQRLLGQLKGYMEQMRSLRSLESNGVRAVDGGKLYDVRLAGGLHGFGPFASVRDFHSFLRDGIDSSPEQLAKVNELVEKQKLDQYGIRFTHGDLSSMNILTQVDNIVGIDDWETAGWFPEYWEYTAAFNANTFNEFWRPEVPRFLDEYLDAAHMERLRQAHFGAF